jgi:hypothetical protein
LTKTTNKAKMIGWFLFNTTWRYLVIRIRKSKKDRQRSGQKKKDKRTNNDLQNTTEKFKIDSNMTSFFRFVNKRASYPFGIISLAHAPMNVTDFSIGSKNCVRHFPQT